MKLGSRECERALHGLWLEEMNKIKAPRKRRIWRMPRQSDSPVQPESLESLRFRMWRGGVPKTITIHGRELFPIDSMAARITR